MAVEALEVEAQEEVIVGPFAIEADHPRNCDLWVQGIAGGVRLRSRLVSSRTIKDSKSGNERVPQDQARHLGMLPEIPGMRLHVNPIKLAYKIIDPLHDDKELCERIQSAQKIDGRGWQPAEVKGVPEALGDIDVDRMKTLCREIWHMVNNGHANVVAGKLPSMDTIKSMQGKFLTNPGSIVHNSQPQYEEDLPAWRRNLDRIGA